MDLGLLQPIAWIAATTSVLLSVAASARRMRTLALLAGVGAGLLQSVLLVTRAIFVAVDLLNNYPWPVARRVPFAVGGLGVYGLLLASCGLARWATRDRRLTTCGFWIGTSMVIWAGLLLPPIGVNALGGFERTSATLVLLASLAAWLATSSLAHASWCGRRTDAPSGASVSPGGRSSSAAPGYAVSCAVVATWIGFLACYHLLVPLHWGDANYQIPALLTAGSAVLGAYACFRLLDVTWHAGLVDAAMGLCTLGLGSLATAFVPSWPVPLVERYPMLFTAMIVGFAAAAASWTYLAEAWSAAGAPAGENDAGPRDGMPNVADGTPAATLIPYARRSAYLGAALALLVSIMMSFWPRLPGIAVMDHSYGRVLAGLGANLFLLWVMLWSARRLRRPTLELMTLLTAIMLLAFLAVRMMPFASHVS